jgi:FkbM family methyltransferase
MIAVDVGAYVGRHGFEMARLVDPGGHVHLFEPLPQMVAELQRRLVAEHRLRSVTSVYPCALSSSSGSAEFCVAVDALAYAGLKERHYDTETAVERIQVEVRRLDEVLPQLTRFDDLKIDTEGAEWQVLQGAERLIAKFRPTISFEFGENAYAPYGVNPGEVHAFLISHGYRVFDIRGRELDGLTFIESSRRQQVWDYVAIEATNDRIAAVIRSI